ncbi:MAG TPA: Mov34/MPN/PAD-1 family protein, partial [Tepidisphaeraceae bacterium]|nr:Mov34/MPN/PAD-1 family protein [Tepidisphaeraceae bacterium]
PDAGPRQSRYQVIFRQSVLDEIHAHGKASPECEICGVLVGNVYQDRVGPWAYIDASIRGNGAVGKQTQVTITSDTWSRIHETLERDFPGRQIVGWYHTHPGFGIFLSGMDLFIQDNFFNQPWQFAFVYDPIGGDEGAFIWRSGKSEREPFLIEKDTKAPPAGAATGAASGDAVAELLQRVKKLERRMDFVLTGFLVLILLALVAPLVIFFIGPDNLNLPMLHKHPQGTQSPAATQPTVMPDSTPVPKPNSAPVHAPATQPVSASHP